MCVSVVQFPVISKFEIFTKLNMHLLEFFAFHFEKISRIQVVPIGLYKLVQLEQDSAKKVVILTVLYLDILLKLLKVLECILNEVLFQHCLPAAHNWRV